MQRPRNALKTVYKISKSRWSRVLSAVERYYLLFITHCKQLWCISHCFNRQPHHDKDPKETLPQPKIHKTRSLAKRCSNKITETILQGKAFGMHWIINRRFWQWFKDSNMQSSKTQIILRDRYTAPAAKQVTVENGRWKVIVEGCIIQAMENNRLQEGRMKEEKHWIANTEERFYQLREVKRKAEKTAAEGARTCVLPKEGCNVWRY